MTDSKDNMRAMCAKGKHLNRMKMDRHTQNKSRELGPGRWAQEQSYSRRETLANFKSLLGLGSHSFSLVYRTGAEGMKTQRCVQEDLPWKRLLEVSTQMPCLQQTAKLEEVVTSTSEN